MLVYVMRGKERLGPYSPDQIRSLLDKAQFVPADIAWFEGLQHWTPLSKLLPRFPAPIEPPAAPRSPSRTPDKGAKLRFWISIALLLACFVMFVVAVAIISEPKRLEPLTKLFSQLVVVAAIVGFSSGRKRYGLLIFSSISTVGALFLAITALGVWKQQEGNKRFASTLQTFAKDAQRYAEGGGSGPLPNATLTGDPTSDEVIRCVNDAIRTVGPIFVDMNRKLTALQTPDDALKTSLSADELKQNCRTEANKRTQSRAIIAKARNDATAGLENFVATAKTRYGGGQHGQEIRSGLESGMHNAVRQWQTMFNLLDEKAKAELDLYEFLAKQEFRNGQVTFRSQAERLRYHAISAAADNAAKGLESFQNQLLANMNSTAERFGK
jgi:hypothetical protein